MITPDSNLKEITIAFGSLVSEKEESEKTGLKLNIQKMNIMASDLITHGK